MNRGKFNNPGVLSFRVVAMLVIKASVHGYSTESNYYLMKIGQALSDKNAGISSALGANQYL